MKDLRDITTKWNFNRRLISKHWINFVIVIGYNSYIHV